MSGDPYAKVLHPDEVTQSNDMPPRPDREDVQPVRVVETVERKGVFVGALLGAVVAYALPKIVEAGARWADDKFAGAFGEEDEDVDLDFDPE